LLCKNIKIEGGIMFMASNRSIDNHTFFKNQTTTGVSDYMITSDASEMNLKFECTGTFEVKITADIYPKNINIPYLYPCYKQPTYEPITTTITDGTCLYNVNLSAIDYLRIEILSLTGTISIYGKVVG
jgi:hypothetical protein